MTSAQSNVLEILRADGRAIFDHVARYEQEAEQMREMLASLPAPAWIKRDDGVTTFVNRFFCIVMNRDPEDYVGKTNEELWPEPYASRYRERDRIVLADPGNPHIAIEEGPLADGTPTRWYVMRWAFVCRVGNRFAAGIAFPLIAVETHG